MVELKRRRLLTGGAAALAAGAALTQCDPAQSAVVVGFGSQVVPFHGAHQAGIATPAQAHALFVALDLRADAGRSAHETLAAVLKLWSADAARLTQGRPALADTEPELATRPARLTVSVGLGPPVFDRIGLAHRRPPTAIDRPACRTDRRDPRYCGGEVLLQICAADPMVVAHTARVLLKNVRTMTVQRWRQHGFRTARGADRSGTTLRNLMGPVAGPANLRTAAAVARFVWDDGAAQPWFAGGTIAVLRRIRAELDTWDELDRASKEFAMGRRLDTGAPLTGTRETDEPDLTAQVNGIRSSRRIRMWHWPGRCTTGAVPAPAVQLRRPTGRRCHHRQRVDLRVLSACPGPPVRPGAAPVGGCGRHESVDHHGRVGDVRDAARGGRGWLAGPDPALMWRNSPTRP
jgi:dye decolorizing peroxidase